MLSFLIIALIGLTFFGLSALLGSHSGGHDVNHSGESAISEFFTIRNLFLFITGFGSAGQVAEYYGANPVDASFIGAAGGFSLVVVIVVVYHFACKQDSNTVISEQDVVGETGNVITAIPKGGQGEIVVNDSTGRPHCFYAVSNEPITSGKVTVKSVVGNVATVVPAV